jgi:quercetin dioxygenase-like cupin family protein
MSTQANAGQILWFLDTFLTIPVSEKDGGDGVSVIDHRVRHGDSPPLHIHRNEDETFHIVEGEFRFVLNGAELRAGAGTTVHIPKGSAHSYRAESPSGGRFLTITARGDFERFVRAMARPATHAGFPPPSGPPPPEVLAEFVKTAAAHGIDIIGPPLH